MAALCGAAMAAIAAPANTVFTVEGPNTANLSNNQLYWSAGRDPNAVPPAPVTGNGQLGADKNATPPYFGYRDSSNRTYYFVAKHSGMGNVVWCDGHAKAMKVGTLADYHMINNRAIFYYFTNADD